MGNPTYITRTASGSSPWFSVNYQANPVNISLAVISVSTNWQVDVTLDDPFGTFPSTAGPTLFLSSQAGTLTSGTTVSAIGSITIPIAALRLTMNSTTGTASIATMTVLQSGIG